MSKDSPCFEGGCTCGTVRYRMTATPMIVHCCHCFWCQRETGSAFVINALIETDRLPVLKGEPVTVVTPSHSGKGQRIVRCPTCQIALWSHYAGVTRKIAFLRVGTLDTPHMFSPDIHIYTASKQPWITLPDGVPAVRGFYKTDKIWSAESLARWAALRANA